MKYILLILSLSLFFSCKESKNITSSTNTSTTESAKEVIAIKEVVLLIMERTPCYGKCPAYKTTIYNTGKVLYEGFSHTDKIGKYAKTLSTKQIAEIEKMIDVINFYELEDEYGPGSPDHPTTKLVVVQDGGNKKKQVINIINPPGELTQFEKLIDYLTLDKKLIKL